MNRRLFWLGAAILAISLAMFAAASYNVGALPTMVLGAWLMADACRRNKPEWPRLRGITRVLTVLVSLYLLAQGVCVALILHAHSEPPARNPDAIVVLGAGFWGDTISTVLTERLEAAVSLHRRYPRAVLVLSGGKGFGEQKTEAELMRGYLLQKGIPDERLLLEDQAMDTIQNFRNSKALLNARFGEGRYATVFVTSEFHLYRSQKLAAREGLPAACEGTDTEWFLLPAYLVRETVAILHDLI